MRPERRLPWRRVVVTSLIALACTALPALAQEQSSPDPSDSMAATIFKWVNFALVMGGIAYVIGKFGAPYFREHARSISHSIRHAAEERALAEKELNEVTQKLARIDSEIQEMRKAAASDSAAQAERIRSLAKSEVDRINQAVQAEITAAERAAAQELRAATARLATEQAAALVRARMIPAAESNLFRTFLREIGRSTT